jgi:hypothetical protein
MFGKSGANFYGHDPEKPQTFCNKIMRLKAAALRDLKRQQPPDGGRSGGCRHTFAVGENRRNELFDSRADGLVLLFAAAQNVRNRLNGEMADAAPGRRSGGGRHRAERAAPASRRKGAETCTKGDDEKQRDERFAKFDHGVLLFVQRILAVQNSMRRI